MDINLSLGITICHHSASLMMPNGDPRDGFFYLTLILMIDFYNPSCSTMDRGLNFGLSLHLH